MRKLTALLVAAGMVATMSGQAMAAGAEASTTASITATVLTPIAIAQAADLNFGSFAIDATAAGTVVVTPTGARSVTGGADLLTGNAGTVTAASFSVTGEGTSTYSITLPSSDVTVTHTNTTDTMTVNTFTSDPDSTGTLTAGAQTVNVGATLNVANGQLAGVYTHDTGVAITVAYN